VSKLKHEILKYKFEKELVSIGNAGTVPNDFELNVYPPYYYPGIDTEDDILKVKLTSAAILPWVVSNNGILLVQMTENGQERIEIPSGTVEKSKDKNIYSTATREFQEEVGIEINNVNLIPITYAFNHKKETDHYNGTGGIQFLALLDEIKSYEFKDSKGRIYIKPFDLALPEEIESLILEPLEIFMNPYQSLLSNSTHPWATRLIRGALRTKLGYLSGIVESEPDYLTKKIAEILVY
jgi:8-oxo-dGTP pyrophosphatase MutT (NUDIX family)